MKQESQGTVNIHPVVVYANGTPVSASNLLNNAAPSTSYRQESEDVSILPIVLYVDGEPVSASNPFPLS